MLSKNCGLLFILISIAVYIVWLKKIDTQKFISVQDFLRTTWINRPKQIALPSLTLSELEELQLERKKLIFKSCQSIFSSSNSNLEEIFSQGKTLLRQIIVDDKNQLLYCYVPKVACTNWKRVLMVLTGKVNTSDPLSIDSTEAHKLDVFKRLDNYSEEEIRHRLDHYVKFMFVRHPYERALSAYRDKLNPGNKYFQKVYGRKIVQMYRLNATEESLLAGDDVSFPEFVRYLINFDSSAETYNEHRRPMADLCVPCVINYDIIGKYETINDDARLVLTRARLGQRVQFPFVEKNSTTTSLLHKFMNELTREEVERLFNVYKQDFNFFGYNPST